MKREPERFDMSLPPVRTRWYLRPLAWLLSTPDTIRHRTVIRGVRTEGPRPPYVLLCDHNAFPDFRVRPGLSGRAAGRPCRSGPA